MHSSLVIIQSQFPCQAENAFIDLVMMNTHKNCFCSVIEWLLQCIKVAPKNVLQMHQSWTFKIINKLKLLRFNSALK